MRLYFENTFVGRSALDLRTAADTLVLSLGRDEGIEVQRELVQEGSRQWVFSGKRVVSRKCKRKGIEWRPTERRDRRSPLGNRTGPRRFYHTDQCL